MPAPSKKMFLARIAGARAIVEAFVKDLQEYSSSPADLEMWGREFLEVWVRHFFFISSFH